MDWIFKKVFNIRLDSNQKWILASMALSGLLMTYVHPMLLKVIISALPAEWIAFESMVFSLASLLIGVVWRGKMREIAVRYFLILAIIESTCGFLLGMYLCFIDFNVWAYAIGSLIYSSLITTFVGKCIMCFKAKLWIEKEREFYDNNISIVGGIVCLIGYLFALIMMPSLKVSLFLWGLCCIIDDIGWIIVYIKNQKNLKDINTILNVE